LSAGKDNLEQVEIRTGWTRFRTWGRVYTRTGTKLNVGCKLPKKTGTQQWYLIDADPRGHPVQRLVAEFPRRTEIVGLDGWLGYGALLDQF